MAQWSTFRLEIERLLVHDIFRACWLKFSVSHLLNLACIIANSLFECTYEGVKI